jgi:hypothetical protein
MTPAARQLFDDIILDDPGVCNNCYRHTHDVIDHWYPSRYIDTTREDMFVNPRHYRRLDTTNVVYLADEETGSQKTACECGVLDGEAFERPLSTSKVIDYTGHIADRLDAAGLEFDENTLFDRVRSLKTDPDTFKSDEEIFREAVREASTLNVREFASKRLIEAE